MAIYVRDLPYLHNLRCKILFFAGDQFKLPEQALQLETFFTVFYFSINCGSLLSTIITPILREERCFGEDSCFSLAFGVPAILMAAATLVIISGPQFRHKYSNEYFDH